MSVPVLTALSDPDLEASLVAGLQGASGPVHVVRRCVELAELLSAAAAGVGRAAVVSPDLRSLDREALTRLAVAGVAVVGVVAPGDEPAERRLRQLGVAHVVTSDTSPDAVAETVLAAVGSGPVLPAYAVGDPSTLLAQPPAPRSGDDDITPAEGGGAAGRVIAVWGPAGAPGRSTIAIGLAAELAELGLPTLLVDADGYGGTVAQLLGLLDESPGTAAACRLANNGTLDLPALAELALEVRPRLRVLTGISRPDRWPELRPAALDVVLGLARGLAAVTVVDCGFCLERDEELSFDTAAPRRNGAALTALAAADTVVAVASGDPVGLQRFVRGLAELADAVPGVTPTTVVNRVRAAAVGGGNPTKEIAAALQRFAGVRDPRFVPLDMAAYDAAVAGGRLLLEVAPKSPARLALKDIAADLAGLTPPRPRGRWSGARRTQRAR